MAAVLSGSSRKGTWPRRAMVAAVKVLTVAGLPELITTSAEDYEQLALRLNRDRSMLAALRGRLAATGCHAHCSIPSATPATLRHSIPR